MITKIYRGYFDFDDLVLFKFIWPMTKKAFHAYEKIDHTKVVLNPISRKSFAKNIRKFSLVQLPLV